MKPMITPGVVIENTDDAQPGILPLTDFSVPNADTGLTEAGTGSTFPAAGAADVLDPVFISNGGNSSGAEGSMFLVSLPVLSATSVTYAPLVITPIFGTSILDQVGGLLDPTTASQIENAVKEAINYYETNWTSS